MAKTLLQREIEEILNHNFNDHPISSGAPRAISQLEQAFTEAVKRAKPEYRVERELQPLDDIRANQGISDHNYALDEYEQALLDEIHGEGQCSCHCVCNEETMPRGTTLQLTCPHCESTEHEEGEK